MTILTTSLKLPVLMPNLEKITLQSQNALSRFQDISHLAHPNLKRLTIDHIRKVLSSNESKTTFLWNFFFIYHKDKSYQRQYFFFLIQRSPMNVYCFDSLVLLICLSCEFLNLLKMNEMNGCYKWVKWNECLL